MAIKQLARKKDGLGLWSLTSLVVGSMIGAGIFNLVQGTAEAAGPLATIIAWLITGVGMIFLILSFRNLTIKKPKLNAGVYSYAEAGFGKYVGFNSAWGYWISAWIGNIAYAVAVFSALDYFFPDLFLNDAVAAAKQSEAAIQSAALAAVVKAENDKTAQAKNDAQALVNQVKDPQKKARAPISQRDSSARACSTRPSSMSARRFWGRVVLRPAMGVPPPVRVRVRAARRPHNSVGPDGRTYFPGFVVRIRRNHEIDPVRNVPKKSGAILDQIRII